VLSILVVVFFLAVAVASRATPRTPESAIFSPDSQLQLVATVDCSNQLRYRHLSFVVDVKAFPQTVRLLSVGIDAAYKQSHAVSLFWEKRY